MSFFPSRMVPALALMLILSQLGASFFSPAEAREPNSGGRRQLKVLQLNTWLLKFLGLELSEDRKDRQKIMPISLASTGADIITLQEVWKNRTKKEFRERMRELGYPYSYFTIRGASLGDGLMILSRFPILSGERSEVFRPKTRPDEAIAQKRAIKAVVDVPNVGPVDIYTTHLGAVSYDAKTDTFNPQHHDELLIQMERLARFMKTTRTSPFAVVTGDLNYHYQVYAGNGEFEPRYARNYERFVRSGACQEGDLQNSFLLANGMDVSSPAVPTYSRENPYVRDNPYFKDAPSEVLDYILFCPSQRIRATHSSLALHEPIPESYAETYGLKKLPARVADHFGLMTTFEIE